MFGTFLIIAVTLMQGYVFWRIYSIPFVKARISPAALILIGVIIWGLFYLGRTVGHGGTGPAAWWLEMIGMTWLGVIFISFACVLVADLLTGFGLLLPRLAPRIRGGALLAAIFLSAIALIQGFRPPVIETYDLFLPGLPPELDGMKLIAVADTHIGSILGIDWLETLIARIREEKPDAILLLGDILEGHGNKPEELVPVLRGLSAPLGVWMVPGNHESYGRDDITFKILELSGVNLLLNSHIELRPGLVLAGIEYRGRRNRGKNIDDRLLKALAGRPDGATILLSHEPSGAELAAEHGVDLMLSGHTHGGQICPWGYLVQTRYPLLAGRYDLGDIQVIVSRGAGTWGPRMRLWQRGEILSLILHEGPE